MQKLIEEVLTGATVEAELALLACAETLIRALGLPESDDPTQGLVPAEIACCVLRALSLPQVAPSRRISCRSLRSMAPVRVIRTRRRWRYC